MVPMYRHVSQCSDRSITSQIPVRCLTYNQFTLYKSFKVVCQQEFSKEDMCRFAEAG